VRFVIQSLPNEVPLTPAEPIDLQWWGDASTPFGIGLALGPHWAMWKWSPDFKVGPHQEFDIGRAEAVAVELGLRLALNTGLLGNGVLRGHTLLVQLDNAGIVAVVNKGCSCSHETNKILKHIYTLLAQHQIHLKSIYIPSHTNISDALS